MHTRTEEILCCLDTELAGLRAAVDAVPVDRRGERPGPDRWSVAEVIEHLVMVERAVMKACSKQVAAARERGLPAETETTSILHLLPPARVANRERQLIAPEMLRPKGGDAVTAWADLELTRQAFREFVTTCDGLALGEVSFAHPSLGTLNLYQWLFFAAGHHARHAAQIREIAQQLQAGAA
jgi:hypothetical protein